MSVTLDYARLGLPTRPPTILFNMTSFRNFSRISSSYEGETMTTLIAIVRPVYTITVETKFGPDSIAWMILIVNIIVEIIKKYFFKSSRDFLEPDSVPA